MADSDAYNRRLQPVYDAIEVRNWKAALKVADAALKKHKGDQLLRALKAYAHIKGGKRAEGLQARHTVACCRSQAGMGVVLAELVLEGPATDRVLSTMTFGYKAAGCPPATITEAYAAAAERRPKDPETLVGLFGCYVREGNFVKQQQVATKLAKLVPPAAAAPMGARAHGAGGAEVEGGGDRYGWWVVCALALQARAAMLGQPAAAGGGGGLAAEKLLQLAQTMAARQGQGSPRKALEVVESDVGAAVPLAADRLQLRAAAALRAGDAAAAATCYKEALLGNPDDWQSWQLYLDCLLPGTAAPGGVAMAAPSGSRFPAGVVGGLADLQDRMAKHAQQQLQQLQQQGQERGSGPAMDAAAAAAAVAAAEETLVALQAAVLGNDTWREQAAAGSLRTPQLASLELLLRRLRLVAPAGSADSPQRQQLLQQLVSEVAHAYRQLGHTFSCTPDLRAYLAVLAASSEHAAWLAAEVRRAADEAATGADNSSGGGSGGAADAVNGGSSASAGNGNSSSSSRANGVQLLQRLVNARLLESELGLPAFTSADEAEAHARQLLELYEQHLPLSETLDEKERGYGEELVAVAVAALLAAGRLGGPGQLGRRMVQAVLVLEAAQVRRKVSAPFRLACTALYSLLGAPQAAARHFAGLDVKHILHDSMTGHWLLPGLLSGGADGELARWLAGVAGLHADHERDAGDTLLMAHQHGTYSKVGGRLRGVLEFVDFKERLLHSHTRLLGKAEDAALQLRGAAAGGDPAALAEAAAEAARRLGEDPLAELVGGLEQGEDQQGAERPAVRFDEDVATRPVWFPPHAGPARAGVAGWWEAADTQQAAAWPGFAACWWSGVAAAESRGEAAATWRAGQQAALQRRWLLPSLLAAVLSKQLGKSELAALLRCSQLLSAGTPLADSAAGLLDGLLAALAAAAYPVQAVLAAREEEPDPASVAAGQAALERLGQQWQAACEAATAALSTGGQLPGLPLPASRAPALASSLLTEEAAWTAACLHSWSLALVQASGSPGKRSPAAQAAAGQLLAGVRQAAANVRAGIEGVAALLGSLGQPTQQELVKQAAAALDLFGSSAGAGASQQQAQRARPPWGFERQFKPLEAVKTLVGEQREVVQRLQAAAHAALRLLGGVAA
eukprot:scaffold14.g1333.t1